MSFGAPLFLLLLPLLPLLSWLRGRIGSPAAFLYSSVSILRGVSNLSKSRAGAFLNLLRWLAVAFFIVALARPRLSEGETNVSASGIDIVVAIDLSSSMAAEDFEVEGQRVNRLTIAKEVIKEFIDGRGSDRIGLIAFAGSPYVAAPLTLDHNYLFANIDRLDLGIIEDGTAIGAGLMAGLNRLRDLESKSKIVILMTDGQENQNRIPPLTAAETAETLGVKVYTIGVGTRGEAPMPVYDNARRLRGYQRVDVNIDEETLREIAIRTDGKYYRADDSERFRGIYREIDQLEKTEVEVNEYYQYQELYGWFTLAGVLFLLAEILLGNTIYRRIP